MSNKSVEFIASRQGYVHIVLHEEDGKLVPSLQQGGNIVLDAQSFSGVLKQDDEWIDAEKKKNRTKKEDEASFMKIVAAVSNAQRKGADDGLHIQRLFNACFGEGANAKIREFLEKSRRFLKKYPTASERADKLEDVVFDLDAEHLRASGILERLPDNPLALNSLMALVDYIDDTN